MASRGYFKFCRLIAFAIILLASGCGYEPKGPQALTGGREAVSGPNSGISARVVEVVDGDTVKVKCLPGPAVGPKGDGCGISGLHGQIQAFQIEKVRLIGVNAPELGGNGKTGELLGVKAKNYTRERLLNQVVTLEFDVVSRDRYGRLLAYVYVKGSLFNLRIVRDGYAQVYTSPPNLLHSEELLAAQHEAILYERGLWAARDFYAGRVIGNRRSFVYHRPGCADLPSLANRAGFKNEKEAVLAGYRACKNCCSRPTQEVGN